jgi:hypothetical protein
MRSTGNDGGRTLKAIQKTLRERAATHAGASRYPAVIAARRAVEAVEAEYELTLIERIELRNSLVKDILDLAESKTAAQPSLPKTAPELWSEREGRKENPVAFTRRVYAPWLNRGLMRGDLRSLDPSLYQALAVWLHRHPEETFPEMTSSYAAVGERIVETIAKAMKPGRQRRAKLPHLRGK